MIFRGSSTRSETSHPPDPLTLDPPRPAPAAPAVPALASPAQPAAKAGGWCFPSLDLPLALPPSPPVIARVGLDKLGLAVWAGSGSGAGGDITWAWFSRGCVKGALILRGRATGNPPPEPLKGKLNQSFRPLLGGLNIIITSNRVLLLWIEPTMSSLIDNTAQQR